MIEKNKNAAETSLSGKNSPVNELYYSYLFKSAQDGILILDAVSRKIIDSNPAAEKLLRLSRENLIGKELREIELLKDTEHNFAFFEELGENGSVNYDDLTLCEKNGSQTRVEFNASMFSMRDLRLVRCLIRDIGYRKQGEEINRELLEELSNFKFALDESSIVAITDQKGKITYVNDKFCQISKYSREELIGQDHRLINSGYHPKEFIRDLWTTIASGKVWRGELRNRAKDGSIYWVDTTIVPFLDKSGKPFQYIAIRNDITQIKLAENALRRQAMLIEQSYEPIFVWDFASNRITEWNAGCVQLYGFSREEALGQKAWKLLKTKFPVSFDEALSRLKSGYSWTGELQHRTKDSRKVVVECRLQFLNLEGEEIVLETNQNITERKRVENKLRRLNETLEQRVAERTSELKAANRELEAFSYSVSHDLRSPLRAIDGFSLALLEDYGEVLDAEGKTYLNRVRAASQRMEVLIEDLLKLSRLTRSEMNREIVNLSALAREIAERFYESQPKRNVIFDIQENVEGFGDGRLLSVVLENLLGNAWKFTSKCEKAEIIFGQQTLGDKTEYFVRDNGVGFDMTYADKLFGAFQRLHTVSEFEGTGIGLATVQRVIRRHGGQIRAESRVGEGTSFYFTL